MQPTTATSKRTKRKRNLESAALAFPILDAPDRIGISTRQAYEEIRLGRLKAKKAGVRTLITEEAAKAYLASLPDFTA